jgi:N-acetylneuraminic acid mutarotase
MKKSTSKSGFFSPRVLIAFLVLATTCSIVMGTLSRPEAPAKTANRNLTFEERVSYQRAVEDVYWRHRIWPKERPDPKPSLDAVMSQAQLEEKVTDYLRKSQALEDYWQRPITAEQLQGEMDRMAQHSKQPEVLQELFEALGNDPFVIAECLARPALAERLLASWYSFDQRIHGELKQRVEAELQAHPSIGQMKQLGGSYNEIELTKSDGGEPVGQAHRLPNKLASGVPALQRQDSKHSVKLNSHEWDETVQKLAATFGVECRQRGIAAFESSLRDESVRLADADMLAHPKNVAAQAYVTIPIGKLSPLQEDDGRYYVAAVIKNTRDHSKLSTVSWLKEPLDSWLARAENHASRAMPAPGANNTLPKISEGGCVDDTWAATAGAPSPRGYHSAVWTGSEMIVWGGNGDTTGGRYNPATDTWTSTSTTNAPEARTQHTAVWTGSEMLIWGGSSFVDLNTGGRYNPSTDSWIATSTNNAPDGRYGHTAVWTGSEMIIWGGGSNGNNFNTGGRYNPNTDSWTATSITNAPSARSAHTAVWTGGEMIVWGGGDCCNFFNTGARYSPNTDSWTATSTGNAPSAREFHTAVWSGSEMIVWGGYDDVTGLTNTGGRYNPGTNSWTGTSTTNAPDVRDYHTAVWTGSEMIVWGGFAVSTNSNTGGKYNPGTNTWTATSITNAPDGRQAHTVVWTGNEMIVWGGYIINPTDTGGRYNPDTDTWVPTSAAPSPRYSHTAVWTGSEMIVWGGNFDLSAGGRYNPSTDSWVATSITNAPDGRYGHTAVWTGSEMIVWGGSDLFNYFNTGGRYDPGSDSWVPISTTNAPAGRYAHTAVWTGNEMIVWGGYFSDGGNNYLNTGGRYNPSTDSWVATSTTNAPIGRDFHTAVWSGSEMIAWGGYFYDGSDHYLDTGGRYDPITDSWTATTTANAPAGRDQHTAVWTDGEMIIWGGFAFPLNYFNTGGRYNPITDSWTATSITNAPDGRYGHTAVWTGNDMIVWGGGSIVNFFDTGGRYNPGTNSWAATNTTNAPTGRVSHTAVFTGSEMIVWGGSIDTGTFNTGGRYCAQSGLPPTPTPTPSITPSPTPTPTPSATPRVTPRPRPTPHPRPTPP